MEAGWKECQFFWREVQRRKSLNDRRENGGGARIGRVCHQNSNFLRTPAVRGLEELFSAVLKGSSSLFMICVCIAKIRLEIHVNNK